MQWCMSIQMRTLQFSLTMSLPRTLTYLN
uniref:Uncharacterized protein n=1 Tax=Rhizophora mucronata TaxID=61149 RepID=A0A2P2QD56_RHIMU